MTAPRTHWTGHLRLSLVSIDIALYSAVSRGGWTSLRQIHKKRGQPIRHQKTAEGVGPVDTAEIVKGCEAEPSPRWPSSLWHPASRAGPCGHQTMLENGRFQRKER